MAKIALIIVDMQNDFCKPTGALYIPETEDIIQPIIGLINSNEWNIVVFTQDWHPIRHSSFKVFSPHCIQHTFGAEIISELKFNCLPQVIFQKGYLPNVDSLSGFSDANLISTGLHTKLQSLGISIVHIVGVAIEYCVKETTLDAVKYGFDVYVHTSMIKGIDKEACENTLKLFATKGINLIP